MKLLIIDNYDSFTFNLKHMCETYVSSVNVVRNDEISISDISYFDKIIISPGPGLPLDAGISVELVQKYYAKKPILGICLGAQAIAVAFGCKLFNLKEVMHGRKSKIQILNRQDLVYENVPEHIFVGRYHSWAINLSSNSDFIVTAVDKDEVVMSFRHLQYPLHGIQYHPESILTKFGQKILINWLQN
ncbi:MAG: aminodeoxychorismate/anthranilate synthase component II [Flavobacteriales bacterium]|nr:aminodeoxychorismate/anthranilate synthase component II [Flavobacteriales bacterium]